MAKLRRLHSACCGLAMVACLVVPTSFSHPAVAAELTVQLDGENPYSDTTTPKPLDGVTVRVECADEVYTAVTTDGRAHFASLPAGTLKVSFPETPGYIAAEFPLEEDKPLVVHPKWNPAQIAGGNVGLTPDEKVAIGVVGGFLGAILGGKVLFDVLTRPPLGGAVAAPPPPTTTATPRPAVNRSPSPQAAQPVTNSPTRNFRNLPFTGADVTWMMMAGGLLIMLGLFIIVGRRRRNEDRD